MQTERTYSTAEVAQILDITGQLPNRLAAIAHACGLNGGPGSGHARDWTINEFIVMAVAHTLVRDDLTPRQPGATYHNVLPYAHAVADACVRGLCPAYLIMNDRDWLLIDEHPDADRHATDITLRLARQSGHAIRVLHLRPIYTRIEQLDR